VAKQYSGMTQFVIWDMISTAGIEILRKYCGGGGNFIATRI
jgi:hypothetical protein